MSDLKYEKYIMTDLRVPEDVQYRAEEYKKRARRVLWMEDEFVKNSSSVIISWYFKESDGKGSPSHVHEDFDEIVGFVGCDPENPEKLYGKVEFWMEDEKYILEKSCLIWIPKGLRHCPLEVLEVERPILFLAFSQTKKYTKEAIDMEFGK
jgi:hypothetical protein